MNTQPLTGFIGYVTLFAGDYEPSGWAFCDGRILNITSYTALYSIIGTLYGGDGKATFALPDLRGRAVAGVMTDNPSFDESGKYGGSEIVQLTPEMFPEHTHTLDVTITPKAARNPNSKTPENAVYATGANTLYNYDQPDAFMAPYDAQITTSSAGSDTNNNTPVTILHPVFTLNYIICLVGLYPSRV